MSSCVRFAAITPATMAVSKTGPLAERRPFSRSAAATACGKCTRASAVAVLRVASLPPTSTIVGRCSASRCVKLKVSTADVEHFDLLTTAQAQFAAHFTVAIGALLPGGANQLCQLFIAGAVTHGCPQVKSLRGKQAGVELAFRGEARAAARAAKWLRHRRDKTNFAGAVIEAPAL